MGEPKKSKVAKRRIKRVSFIEIWSKIISNAKDILFPHALVCLDCGKELDDASRAFSMCESCLQKLPYITGNQCRYCGEVIEQKYNVCKRCLSALPYFDKVYAPFSYGGFVKRIILNYKDGNAGYLYQYIAKFMSDYYTGLNLHCDIVCYVPSSKSKILKRGFEHNRKVTELISVATQTPMLRPLTVIKNIKDQTRKNRTERLESIKGVFGVVKGFDKSQIWGKDILLIDDVVTTGATVGECARVLKEKLGASTVTVLSLARS